ncbi:hypothetical protein [Gaetbulibacter jejuensis]|uniref:hypothetical protein n=1 Tax=Gaetbulibacter jejuensis TaxID=584607 RepID=UPI00300A0720
MEVKLINHTVLTLDPKWVATNDPHCKIIDEQQDDNYVLLNKNGQSFEIPKSIIKDNNYVIKDSSVTLSSSVYDYWYGKALSADRQSFETLFNDNMAVIFANKELVLSKAEYYCLDPKILTSGLAYMGGFSYCLGIVVDTYLSNGVLKDFDFEGANGLLVLSVKGSPLSGYHNAVFWSEREQKIIENGTWGKNSPSSRDKFLSIRKAYSKGYYNLYNKTEALKSLLNDIERKNT